MWWKFDLEFSLKTFWFHKINVPIWLNANVNRCYKCYKTSRIRTIGCNSRVLTVTGVFILVAEVYRPELALLFTSIDDGYFDGEIDLGGDGKRSLFVIALSSFIAPNWSGGKTLLLLHNYSRKLCVHCDTRCVFVFRYAHTICLQDVWQRNKHTIISLPSDWHIQFISEGNLLIFVLLKLDD